MYFQSNLLFHCAVIHSCLRRFRGSQATLNLQTFQVEVRARNRYYQLFPQFFYREGGKARFSPRWRKEASGFIGWLPYFNKRWLLATDKSAFKAYCSATGLATPRGLADSSKGVIAKRRLSSFGLHIRGPYHIAQAAKADLGADEYFEEFIPGTIAKAWYWDEKPVCLEMLDMPAVAGDGARALRQLIADEFKCAAGDLPDSTVIEALARYQGCSLDTVIPSGARILVDFRYTSPLLLKTNQNLNVLARYEGTKLARALAEAGSICWRGIPEETRQRTLYSLDAIVDANQQLWFLEMNCNPAGHPDVYMAMLEGLFGPADPEEAAQERVPQTVASARPEPTSLPLHAPETTLI